MKHLALIATLTCMSLSFGHAKNDLLNFSNNDTLHGSFLGFKDPQTLRWQSDQTAEPIEFSTKKVRKVIFDKGNPRHPFTHQASIALTNGDILPCSIKKLDATDVTIVTDYAGEQTIPRKNVLSCKLSPLSQKLLYQGPYLESQWTAFDFPLDKKQSEKKDDAPAWEFGSFSWLNKGKAGGLILKDIELPESAIVRYKTESSLYYDLTLILYADMLLPEEDETKKKGRLLNSYEYITQHFGSCLSLKVHSSSASLAYNTIDENGESVHTSIPPVSARNNYRNSRPNATATVEVRCNIKRNIIAVYRNDQLLRQWDLSSLEQIPSGKNVGFCNFSQGNTSLTRLSNIRIAPWNGVLDSAMSLKSNTDDIIILNNGLDRFSGYVERFDTDSLHLSGQYGKMQIPTRDLDSFTFKNDSKSINIEKPSGAVTFRFHSNGHITAKPIGYQQDSIVLEHPILGEFTLDYKYLSSISYDDSLSLLDQWNIQIR